MSWALERTLIVIPAYNEEASVASVVAEVRNALPGIAILVVDDGSRDRTADVAKLAGAIVASLPFNLGVGGAMRTGFRYAAENHYLNVVQVDADGQHDPTSVPELLAALSDADLVLGARFAGRGDYHVRGPRAWSMKVLAKILSRVTKTRLSDSTSGFRASGPAAVTLFAKHYPAEYLGDTIEALVLGARAGLVVTQVPVVMRPRSGGVPSHNPLRSAMYLARVFIALLFALVRPRFPSDPLARS
jgi:glycosyltransferase involved in cell wall biosynthesis